MKKILIALDYAPTSEKVAEAGYSLSKAMGAELTLLHVIENPSYYGSAAFDPIMGFGGYMDMDLLQPDFMSQLNTTSLNFLEKTKDHLGSDDIQTLVKEGRIAETILETAKELHTDIIVMGSHSLQWLENIIMGSETKHVLNHTSIPLYIIPTKKHS